MRIKINNFLQLTTAAHTHGVLASCYIQKKNKIFILWIQSKLYTKKKTKYVRKELI